MYFQKADSVSRKGSLRDVKVCLMTKKGVPSSKKPVYSKYCACMIIP